MRIYLILLLFLGLTGCALYVGTRKISGPDGEPMFVSHCNRGYVTMADCYEEATKHCPAGWIKIDESKEKAYAAGTIVYDRQLYYKCKDRSTASE